MDIGTEKPAIVIEPMQEPVPGHERDPIREPERAPMPEREPEKVPA